jgi:type IV pilus assembly protein PilV
MLERIHTQQGASLIEAMVALLVISVGLLGIATLQLTAMKQNSSSMNHSQAVWYTYNMSDRIRANLAEFDSYDGIDTNNGYSQDCKANACSAAQMRIADASAWSEMIINLPGGRGNIIRNADGLLVTVMWDDDFTGATGTGCGPDPVVDLSCYTLALVQ